MTHDVKIRSVIRFIILQLLLSVMVLSGCTLRTESQQTVSQEGKKPVKLGLLMDSFAQERWISDRDILVARASELGAEVIVQIANGDGEEQEKQAQYLFDQKIDVLLLVPHDAEKAASIVQSAKSRGIKVISYDRLVKNAGADLYISFDNIKVGELMADALVKKVPRGNYLIINGSPLDNNSYMFNTGYYNVLNDSIQKGSIHVVDEYWAKDWRYEEAFNFVEDELRKGKKFDAIIAGNDNLAGAAVDALAEMRLAGKVQVVGHDADLDGCQRVVEGTQVATVYKPIDQIAKTAAEIAINMAKGLPTQTNDFIHDGKTLIPFYKIEPTLVTKDNMVQEVISKGFHQLEEIYMNVPQNQWPKVN